MNEIQKVLAERLVKKGMSGESALAYLRNLSHSLTPGCRLDLDEINRKMHDLGWYDFDLDHYTLSLFLASWEAESEFLPPGRLSEALGRTPAQGVEHPAGGN